jgi:hypothetical protein
MMGICISWKDFEFLESVKGRRVAHCTQQRLQLEEELERYSPQGQGGGTIYSRNEFKIDLYSLTLG